MAKRAYHIVANADGGWDLKKEDSLLPIGNFDFQEEAVREGRILSAREHVALVVHNRAERIEVHVSDASGSRITDHEP